MREAIDDGAVRRNCVTTPSNLIDIESESIQSSVEMQSHPEKMSLLLRFKERSVSGVFVALTVLAMVGWVYLLSSMFVRFVLWYFS